ncbi:hypothetical protein StoSoilB22_36060 [Arthrobacter sp. StoSoilB22]|nr:hypothetical protein StoSoilB22_36060 [Arthrobacter sp. StoSoilB22]
MRYPFPGKILGGGNDALRFVHAEPLTWLDDLLASLRLSTCDQQMPPGARSFPVAQCHPAYNAGLGADTPWLTGGEAGQPGRSGAKHPGD